MRLKRAAMPKIWTRRADAMVDAVEPSRPRHGIEDASPDRIGDVHFISASADCGSKVLVASARHSSRGWQRGWPGRRCPDISHRLVVTAGGGDDLRSKLAVAVVVEDGDPLFVKVLD